jgi:hypothetical protein
LVRIRLAFSGKRSMGRNSRSGSGRPASHWRSSPPGARNPERSATRASI